MAPLSQLRTGAERLAPAHSHRVPQIHLRALVDRRMKGNGIAEIHLGEVAAVAVTDAVVAEKEEAENLPKTRKTSASATQRVVA